ncbi:MAG: trypsin-like serine protease [Thermoguttaceae bacterium]
MSPRSSALVALLWLLAFCPLAAADEAAEKLVLASYKLVNDSSTATGVVYCREANDGKKQLFLVTAGHVFETMAGDKCMLVSRTRRDDGLYQRQEIPIAVRRDGQPLWKKHADQDVAVLHLDESVVVESLPFDCLADERQMNEVHVGDGVRLSVFPERSEANAAGLPILRTGVLAGYPLVPLKSCPTLLVDTNTWTGDSGGAVIHESLRSPSGGPLVLGIVRGMRSIVDTTKESRFVERRVQYPLGIGEVLQAALAGDVIRQNWPEEGDAKK